MHETSPPIQTKPQSRYTRWSDRLNRLWLPLFILVVVVWGFRSLKGWGAFDGFLVPDLKVSYRPALGPGYVLQIANAGSKPLFNVRITCNDWDKSCVVTSQLDSGSRTE